MQPKPAVDKNRSSLRVPRPSRFVAIAVALALLAGCGDDPKPSKAPSGAPKPSARPSIVMIDVSGLRHDDVYPTKGEPRAKATRAFLDGATSFSQATAPSSERVPALAAVMSGYSPHEAGVVGREPGPLVDSIETIAEMLAREGYVAKGFTRKGFVPSTSGLAQGFGEAPGTIAEVENPPAAASEALVGAAKDTPLFLLVVDPVEVKPNADAGDAHAQNVLATDREVAELLNVLKRPSLRADLITVLFSDRGAVGSEDPPAAARPLSDARIHVPLAIRGARFPGGTAKGSCSLADILPTIRDVMGLPERKDLTGRSLLPLAASPESAGRPVLSEGWRKKKDDVKGACLFAMRSAEAKFVATFTVEPAAEWTPMVFDLGKDPGEEHPEPASAVERFDASFQKAVKALSDSLSARKDASADAIRGPYTGGGGSGPCGGH